MYQLKIKKPAYALRAIRKRGISPDFTRKLEKCSSITALETVSDARSARKKSTCKTPFTTWPADKATLTRGRSSWISPWKSMFVSSRPSVGIVMTGLQSIPRKLLRVGGPSLGRLLFHPHFRVKTSAISYRKSTKRSHLQLWKNGENNKSDWGINFHRSSANSDAVAKHSAGYIDFVAGVDPVDPKKTYTVHVPSKNITYLNNTDKTVEVKLPEGHSFNMYPGMMVMIPQPIDTHFYRWEEYHYGMKRRPVFQFAGQWWHMREQGEFDKGEPINIRFKSFEYRKPNYELLNPLDLYFDKPESYRPLNFIKKSLVHGWLNAIAYHMRESKFKINRRPSHFTGMYYAEDHVDQDIQEAVKNALFGCPFCGLPDGPGRCTEQANCLNVSMEAERRYTFSPRPEVQYTGTIKEIEEKIRQRDAFVDHGAYPAPGDKEFNARLEWKDGNKRNIVDVVPDPNGKFLISFMPTSEDIALANEQIANQEFLDKEELEQKQRESTVAGFRGYKDPKYKPKKR